MQSTSFRTLTVVVTVLLLGALALVLWLVAQNSAAPAPVELGNPTTQPTRTSVTTRAQAASSPTPHEDRLRLPDGGFAFVALPDYTISQTATSATLTGPNEGNSLNPVFLLSGGAPEEFVAGDARELTAIFEEFVAYFAEQDDFDADVPQERQVDGAPALSVDIASRRQADGFSGRIVMAQPRADRLFVFVGVAPAARWAEAIEAQYERVLAGVELLDDAPSSTLPTLTPAPVDARLATALAPTPTESSSTAPAAAAAPRRTPLPTPRPTRTPLPPSAPLPTPPSILATPPSSAILANADIAEQSAPAGENVWAATQGGIMAWSQANRGAVWFTALDGLTSNHFDATAACPLPGLGIVFGGPAGLQIFDTRTGRWNSLNTSNSAMSFDDVSTLHCDREHGVLLVGYAQHGLDIFDATSNEWTHIDRNDGLATDVVQHIAMVGDREAIWVSSGVGVSVIRNGEALLYNAANSPLEVAPLHGMVAGPRGAVWIAGRDRLYRVDPNDEWTVYQDGALGDDFPTAPLAGIDAGQEGIIWLIDEAAAVCRFDVVAETCVAVFSDRPGMAPGPATSITADANGAVFYTTRGNGISGFDGTQWRQYRAPTSDLLDNEIRSLAAERNGFLWVATAAGVQQFSPADPTLMHIYPAEQVLPLPDVRTIAPAPIRGLWIGGNDGAALLEDGTWQKFTTAEGLADNRVQVMTADQQRRMWIGTRAGLSIWNGEDFFNLTRDNGLPSDNITALLATEDGVWIGTSNGGLYRFAQNQLRVYNMSNAGLPSDTVTALASNADGGILVGSDRGLVLLQNGRAVEVDGLPPVPIRSLATDGSGRIWAGTADRGLFAYDGAAWRQITQGLPSLTISALILDRFDTLWAGGESGGLVRIVEP